MWELICHHEYCWGRIAADRSPWHSDGILSSVEPLQGANGLHFSTPQSQIVIPRTNTGPWNKLDALGIAMTLRLRQPGGMLLEGDHSFSLWFDSQRVLTFDVPGLAWQVDMSNVPLRAWIQLRVVHNGFNAMNFSYSYNDPTGPGSGEGVTGGSPVFIPPVGAVGPKGIMIGNRIGHPNQHLNGDIASLKVWRRDPQEMPNGFLGRPIDRETAACWTEFLRKLNEALRADPNCAEWLGGVIRQLLEQFTRALANKDPAKIAEFDLMCRQYRELWFAGKVGSPQMQALLVKFRDWLKAEGLLSFDDPNLRPIVENPCVRRLTALLPTLDCDPEVQALIRALIEGK
jgi:hypothetical protein